MNELTVVDIAAGTSERIQVPELRAGDPPFFLVRRGNHMVFCGYSTYALDARDPANDPVLIADDSWYFVPSANPDRVWIVERDETRSTSHHYFFREVREVTPDGDVTAKGPAMGDAWMDGAVDAGVIFQSEDDLVAWDPLEQEVVRRFGNPPMGPSHGNMVVWCRGRCQELHLTDVATGAHRIIPAPPGYERFDAWSGEFTPDGSLLAVPVGNAPRYEGRGAAAVVNVATGDVQVVPGSEEEAGIPSLTWDPTGTRLFLVVGQHGHYELRYFDLGADRAEIPPVTAPRDFVAMVSA